MKTSRFLRASGLCGVLALIALGACSTSDQALPTTPHDSATTPTPPKLEFQSVASTVTANDTIPAFTVEVRDFAGQVMNVSDTIIVSLQNNPNHARLIGDSVAVSVQGIATFTTLRIDSTGTGYTLRATALGVAADTSRAITVTAATSSHAVAWDSMPGAAATPSRFVSLSDDERDEHCGIAADGTVSCWGHLAGPDTNAWSPVAMTMKFTAVTTNNGFACGLTSSGEAWCWGSNADGQLGNGTTTSSATPVAVSGGLHFTQITSGYAGICALSSGGRVYCWGTTNDPSSNNGNALVTRTTPTVYDTARTYTTVTSGLYHTCALDQSGAAWCWGQPGYGAPGLGYDPSTSIPNGTGTPKPVVGGLTFTTLTAGGTQTCGIATDSHTYCWGENLSNQLGSTTTRSEVANPTVVPGVPAFAMIRTGGDDYAGATCALTTAGALWCWGGTHQPNQPPFTYPSRLPTAMASGPFTALSVGTSSGCALDQNGAAKCWGLNDSGQLGRGH